jgi:hypothetical protein
MIQCSNQAPTKFTLQDKMKRKLKQNGFVQCLRTLKKKLENIGGWIEYATVVITVVKCLVAVITAATYSIQPLPLSSFFVVRVLMIIKY